MHATLSVLDAKYSMHLYVTNESARSMEASTQTGGKTHTRTDRQTRTQTDGPTDTYT